MMKPITKWADRVVNLKRIPEMVNNAFQRRWAASRARSTWISRRRPLREGRRSQVDWRLSGRPLLVRARWANRRA
jgi:hypothetical protein